MPGLGKGFSAHRRHENQAHGSGRRDPQDPQPRRRSRTIKTYERPTVIDSGTFLAVVNPAAGGGRCRKLVGPALDRLRAGGIDLEVVETSAPGQATALVRDAYAQGYRKFIAVGGDGTSYEVVNGLFPSETSRAGDAGISSPGNRQFIPARLQRPWRGVRHRSVAGPALTLLAMFSA